MEGESCEPAEKMGQLPAFGLERLRLDGFLGAQGLKLLLERGNRLLAILRRFGRLDHLGAQGLYLLR